jgi:hypothetical protein
MRSKTTLCILLLMAAVAVSPAIAGGPFAVNRSDLDKSASWGIDVNTGKVAIDASLVYTYDPSHGSLVINPNTADEAARALGATVQGDGSWRLPDGTTLTPVRGEEAIVAGDEPDGLVEASGLPAVPVGQVQLVAAAASSTRTRSWHKCNGCTGCLNGCAVNVFYSGDPSYKYCTFSWPWNKCTETSQETCKTTIYSCVNCSGPILATGVLVDWVCADNC